MRYHVATLTTRLIRPQGAVSFCKGHYGGFAKCWGVQRRERERAWSDLYPSWSLTAIPCVALWHLASLTTNALLPLPHTRNFFSSPRANVKLRFYQGATSTCTSLLWPSGHRSHFGSRYTLGGCGHAGLFRKRPASICHITSLMTTISPARPVTSTLLLFAPCTCM